jgi:hypothetical protein
MAQILKLRLPRQVLLFVCFSCAFSSGLLADDATKRLAKRVAAFDSARSSREAGLAREELLAAASDDDCRALKSNNNSSVALLAAWKLRLKRSESDVAMHIEPQRFLGFLEARIGMRPPTLWARQCARTYFLGHSGTDSDLQHRAIDVFTADSKRLVIQRRERSSVNANFWLQPGMQLVKQKNATQLVKGDVTTPLVDQVMSVITDRDSVFNQLSASFDDDVAAVAIHNDAGHGYKLFVLDRKSGGVKWSQNVYGFGTENRRKRGAAWPQHYIEIVVSNQSVLIFGYGTHLYIEGFDKALGVPKIRFTTHGWYWND